MVARETRFYRSLTNLSLSLLAQETWRQINSLGMAEYMRDEPNAPRLRRDYSRRKAGLEKLQLNEDIILVA